MPGVRVTSLRPSKSRLLSKRLFDELSVPLMRNDKSASQVKRRKRREVPAGVECGTLSFTLRLAAKLHGEAASLARQGKLHSFPYYCACQLHSRVI